MGERRLDRYADRVRHTVERELPGGARADRFAVHRLCLERDRFGERERRLGERVGLQADRVDPFVAHRSVARELRKGGDVDRADLESRDVQPAVNRGRAADGELFSTRDPTNESPVVSFHQPSSRPDGLDPPGTCTTPVAVQLTSAPADKLTAAGPPPAIAENMTYPTPASATIATTAIAIHPLRLHLAMPDALRSSDRYFTRDA